MYTLQGFKQISLEKLNTSMQLMERIDKKYIISSDQLPTVLNHMKPSYKVLSVEGKTKCAYETIYMDTQDLQAYHLHTGRAKQRRKARTRLYVDTQTAFFECKIKEKDITRKYRYAISASGCNDVSPESQMFVSELLRSHTGLELIHPLVPVLRVLYKRSTFCNDLTNERVTIDTDIAFQGIGQKKLIKVPGIAIVESKAQDHTGGFAPIAKELHQKSIKNCSKYCLGLIYTGRTTQLHNFATTIGHIRMIQIQHSKILA